MRTYEDIEEALKNYENELARESHIKRDHYIITGGNVNIIKKNIREYTLEKGTPTPMVWETAKKKHAEFQVKCGDNIRLEIIKYSDWLIKNIEDCRKLMKCMEKSLSTNARQNDTPEAIGSEDPKPSVIDTLCTGDTKTTPENPGNNLRSVSLSCPTCPYGVKTCMICKFAVGINTDTFPWTIICGSPEKSV